MATDRYKQFLTEIMGIVAPDVQEITYADGDRRRGARFGVDETSATQAARRDDAAAITEARAQAEAWVESRRAKRTPQVGTSSAAKDARKVALDWLKRRQKGRA